MIELAILGVGMLVSGMVAFGLVQIGRIETELAQSAATRTPAVALSNEEAKSSTSDGQQLRAA